MEPWELHEWYADYLAACNRHDLPAIRAFVAPDVRRAHLPAGVDAWMDDAAELFHAFPDWQGKIVRLIVEDDRIAAHLRVSGTHTGPFRGIAPTRRRINVAEFAFLRVVGGRITEYAGSDDDLLVRSGA